MRKTIETYIWLVVFVALTGYVIAGTVRQCTVSQSLILDVIRK